MSIHSSLSSQTVNAFVLPHAELRQTFQPGQEWQMRPAGLSCWFDYNSLFPGAAPLWSKNFEYRLKPAALLPVSLPVRPRTAVRRLHLVTAA